MRTLEIKKDKIRHFAIVLIVLMMLLQGYDLYHKVMIGTNIKQYFYGKMLENVIPGTVVTKKSDDGNSLREIIYLLTDIDVSNYKTFVEKNIPLLKYTALLAANEDGVGLMGTHKFQQKDSCKTDEDYFDQSEEIAVVPFKQEINTDFQVSKDQLADDQYVLQKLINFDANLNHKNQAMDLIDMVKFSEKKFRIKKADGPQVLILHTHSMERFAEEEPGSEGVVDLGRYLKQILETEYGLSVLHCTTSFDVVDKRTERNGSYERMGPVISKVIKDNPSIQLVMDIHRDGINSSDKFLADVNGKSTAKIMYVNGFCHVQKNGVLTPITRLPNPYVEDNMALSLQLQLKANELYPGLMRKTLVKPYRYSLHMKPMSLLIEVGNQNNIKEEGLNAMEALAEILMNVIEKD